MTTGASTHHVGHDEARLGRARELPVVSVHDHGKGLEALDAKQRGAGVGRGMGVGRRPAQILVRAGVMSWPHATLTRPRSIDRPESELLSSSLLLHQPLLPPLALSLAHLREQHGGEHRERQRRHDGSRRGAARATCCSARVQCRCCTQRAHACSGWLHRNRAPARKSRNPPPQSRACCSRRPPRSARASLLHDADESHWLPDAAPARPDRSTSTWRRTRAREGAAARTRA